MKNLKKSSLILLGVTVILAACNFNNPSSRDAIDDISKEEPNISSSSSEENNSSSSSLTELPEKFLSGYIAGWAAQESMNVFEKNNLQDIIQVVNLQFWNLEESANVVNSVSEEMTKEIVTSLKAKGVRPVFCIINHDGNFNWEIVRKALTAKGTKLVVSQILNTIDQLDLAGADINFEANGAEVPFTDQDHDQFIDFIGALADSLQIRGKFLSVPTFPTNNMLPRLAWMDDLVEAGVDYVLPMTLNTRWGGGPAQFGFNELYASADDMKVSMKKVQPILPVWLDIWGGVSAKETMEWLKHCHSGPLAGYAIHSWDTWVQAGVESEIVEWLDTDMDGIGCDETTSDPTIVDTLGMVGTNPKGGQWLADSDIWSRLQLSDIYSAIDSLPNSAWSAATRIWNSKRDYDLAVENSRWADIKEAYTELESGSYILEAVVAISSPVGSGSLYEWAGASLIHEFEARDCSDAEIPCWEVDKTGRARDLSNFETIHVGLRCDVDKTVRVSLSTKENVEYQYGVENICDGEWQEVVIDLHNPAPIAGAPASSWSPSEAFRLSVGVFNEGQADTTAFAISGITLDRSILELRGLDSKK